jgi:hypothetical protein
MQQLWHKRIYHIGSRYESDYFDFLLVDLSGQHLPRQVRLDDPRRVRRHLGSILLISSGHKLRTNEWEKDNI